MSIQRALRCINHISYFEFLHFNTAFPFIILRFLHRWIKYYNNNTHYDVLFIVTVSGWYDFTREGKGISTINPVWYTCKLVISYVYKKLINRQSFTYICRLWNSYYNWITPPPDNSRSKKVSFAQFWYKNYGQLSSAFM